MEGIKKRWSAFVEKRPALANWIREGGLFLVVSTLITVLRGIFIPILQSALVGLGTEAIGFPGINVDFFGLFEFSWYIIGGSKEQGGTSYFYALLISLWLFELINFFMQRKFVFRSSGNVARQLALYFITFALVTCIVNSVDCLWFGFATHVSLPAWIRGLGTSFLTGGVAMMVFFFANRHIFKEKKSEKTE